MNIADTAGFVCKVSKSPLTFDDAKKDVLKASQPLSHAKFIK